MPKPPEYRRREVAEIERRYDTTFPNGIKYPKYESTWADLETLILAIRHQRKQLVELREKLAASRKKTE